MKKTIFNLTGYKIENVRINNDYMQLIIENSIMNINNPITIYALDSNNIIDLEKIIDKRITKVEYVPQLFIKLEIEKTMILKISLLYEDYIGPEAGSLNYFSGEIIVFE